jgi:predicted dehydrogenase
MQKVKVVAIGCGYWGPNLIRNFIEISETDLVAIADLDRMRLEHMRARYPQISYITITEDYRDFFKMDMDAVVISTPPPTHFAIARDCLLNGLHVLVEKPLAINSNEVRQLIEIAEENGRILMVGHTFEYNPAVHAPYIRFEEPLRLECLHFMECIREGKRTLTDGSNGLRVVEIIEAAQRSLKNGGGHELIRPPVETAVNGHALSPISQAHVFQQNSVIAPA